MCSVDGCHVLFFTGGFSFLRLRFVVVFPLLSVLPSGCSPFAFLSWLLTFVFVGLFSFFLPIFFPFSFLLTSLSLYHTFSALACSWARIAPCWRMLYDLSDPYFISSFETTCFSFLCARAPWTPLTSFTVHNTSALHCVVVGFQPIRALFKALSTV